MNPDLITMEPRAARERLESYRLAVKRRRLGSEEHAQVIRGFEELAMGRSLIDIDRAIGGAGWDAEGRPRLAIARADRESVQFRLTTTHIAFNSSKLPHWHSGQRSDHLERQIPLFRFPRQDPGWDRWRQERAVVPLVPADIVPPGAGRLSSLFVLWEAEWLDVPVDPYLLRHIGGSLYVALARWDLNPVEQAVLRGRLT